MIAAPRCPAIPSGPIPALLDYPENASSRWSGKSVPCSRDPGSGWPAPWCRAGLSGFGDPGAGLEGAGEGVKGADAVAGGGGEAGPDRAELLRAGHGPHAAGDLDPQLAHPDGSLSFVIGPRRQMRMMRMMRRIRLGFG